RALSAGILWPGADEARVRRELAEVLVLGREKQRRVADSFERACSSRPALRQTLAPQFLAVEEQGRESMIQLAGVLAGDPAAIQAARAEFSSAAKERLDQ